jgi:hypothetical protein
MRARSGSVEADEMPSVAIHFMVGTGRCGSTIVHETLCRHPEIAFVSNLEDQHPLFRRFAGWNGRVYRAMPEGWTRKGRLRFAPSEAYRALDREVAPLISEPYRDLHEMDATAALRRRLRAFFLDRPHGGAGLLLHKFTGWPRAGFLHSAFPEARYIHVVRDGRAVANSWLQMPWWRGHLGPEGWHFGPLPEAYADEWAASDHSLVVLAALAWKLLLDAYEQAERLVGPDRWLTVRYEQFAADPVEVTERCLGFLGLEATPELSTRVRSLSIGPAHRDAFVQDLGAEAYGALTEVLRGHLERWGYPT